MVCVRPRMKSTESGNSSMNFSISGQCPVSWQTSSLIKPSPKPSTLAVILNIFKAELVEISDLWIGLKKTSKGFEWMDQSSWTYEHRIEWAVDRGTYDRNSYGVSLTTIIPEPSRGILESSSLKWKMWPKEARLNGFICQKEIFPQPEATLQMHLDISYRPLVTAKRVPLLVREVQIVDTPKDLQLKDYELNSATKNEPLFISRLSCFFDNSNFIEDYESGDAMINYKVIETKVPGTIEWRAAEISCETWDEWSPETIRASWIISGDPYGNASFSSLIVWLRHRTVNYSSEIHDATFKASSSQRAAFKRSLHDVFVQEFVKLYPLYMDSLLSASEPVAFESEPFPNHHLLVKYRILINLNPLMGRMDGYGNLWSPDNGEFLEFSRQPMELMTTLSWPKSTVGSRVASAPHCVTRDGLMLRRRCLGDRSSGLYWE
ncbi:uncharacterized protein LOC124336234 [Daphnia pulicaria]|uniref:uncharacterized protein LOC124336234 n=1 Tax=Daphnia pulicaria TaxID=35523 RepID=UPI001EEB2360|nr:uncharacterized protein LOC124336234 [Daphnia pulicaria]